MTKFERWYLILLLVSIIIAFFTFRLSCNKENILPVSIVIKYNSSPISDIPIYLSLDSSRNSFGPKTTDHRGIATFENINKGTYTYYFKFRDSTYFYKLNVFGSSPIIDTPNIKIKRDIHRRPIDSFVKVKSPIDSVKVNTDSNKNDRVKRNRAEKHLKNKYPFSIHSTWEGRPFDPNEGLAKKYTGTKRPIAYPGNGRTTYYSPKEDETLVTHLINYSYGYNGSNGHYRSFINDNNEGGLAVYTNCIDCGIQLQIGDSLYDIPYTSKKYPQLSDITIIRLRPTNDFKLKIFNRDGSTSMSNVSHAIRANQVFMIGLNP